MSRTVFDNSSVAHVWAQQNKPEGKSHNGNFWFEGPKLYSYSTVIGRFVETVDGRKAVLINSNHYSMTTSGKHMPALRRALSSDMPQFHVPNLGQTKGFYGMHDTGVDKAHAANLEAIAPDTAELIKRAASIRMGTRDTSRGFVAGHSSMTTLDPAFIRAATQSVRKAAEYAEAFGLQYDALAADVAIGEALKVFAEREAAWNTGPAAEKRAKAAEARRIAKDAKDKRDAAAAFAKAAQKRSDWLFGLNVRPYGITDEDGRSALLRVVGDELETSQGASVPLAHAVKVFQFVKLVRERGEPWTRNGKTIRVGHFQVDRIEADGSFRAGCHSIRWNEVERIARAIGVFDVAPAADVVTSSH